MKNQDSNNKQFRSLTYFAGLLLIVSWFASISYGKNTIANNFFFKPGFENDTPPDTIPEEEIIEDTLVYTDGADTIYELNDTLPPEDSLGIYLRDIEPVGNFYVTLGGVSKNINQGIYGIHIGGMFDNATLPNESSSVYAWQWLIDLAPNVLRFPSGSFSKFMHLLHNTDGTDAKGYGYDIFEIARYFDWTDDEMEFDFTSLTTSEIDQILYDDINEIDDDFGGWISHNNAEHFIKFREKWFAQQCVNRRYIDDFIDLVNEIDETYPGRPATKVILDLNILSETATECRAIADYLRINGVNVVGVEMGNETYADFFCDALEFHEFDDYYSYINGTNLIGNVNVLENKPGTSADMWGDHDFITKFKTGGGFNYKIGVCGMPLGNDFAFRVAEGGGATCAETETWNDSLRTKYTEIVTGTSKYKFDAVIMHTYYELENWENIPFTYLIPETGTCAGLDELWQFDEYDERLVDAFDGIIGFDGMEGNFRDFLVRTTGAYKSYKNSFNKFNAHFDFDLTTAEKKELWTTEWNLKDNRKGLTELEKAKAEIYTNGFTHGHLLLQWWLKNIKINFDGAFRQNFYTYTTLQNYAGGASTDLINLSDEIERDYFGKDDCPYDENCAEPLNCIYDENWDKRNYHIRRTSYFVTYLFSEISKQNLKYLPSTFYLGTGNINIQPTIFIDPAKEFLYVYFTNVKDNYQNYYLDPTNLRDLYPDAAFLDLGLATVTYLQADQLYSTSGKSSLYDKTYINTCYAAYDHPFEITSATEAGILPAIITEDNNPQGSGGDFPNGILTALPYTLGYFKVPIYPVEDPFKTTNNSDPYQLEIFPNPSAITIQVMHNGISVNFDELLQITILDMEGDMIQTTQINLNETLDISHLAAGCYLIKITDKNQTSYNKKLIKTE